MIKIVVENDRFFDENDDLIEGIDSKTEINIDDGCDLNAYLTAFKHALEVESFSDELVDRIVLLSEEEFDTLYNGGCCEDYCSPCCDKCEPEVSEQDKQAIDNLIYSKGKLKTEKPEFPEALYEVGDEVTFSIDVDTQSGSSKKEFEKGHIYIVDRYGTFEQSEEPSYDIMVDNWENSGEKMLVKHIRQSSIIAKVGVGEWCE